MRGAGEDEPLLGPVDVRRGDALVGRDRQLLDDLASEGVDQPGLPGRELLDAGERRLGEDLPDVVRVLGVERAQLFPGEVADAQGGDLDVERARGAHALGIPTARGLVVAHVAETAEDDRGGEIPGAARESGAKLAQHAEQALAAQGVDLVEEEDERPRARARPRGEGGDDQGLVTLEREGGRTEIRRQVDLGRAREVAQDGALGRAVVVAGDAALLAVEDDGGVLAGGGEPRREGADGRRLARLSGGMDDEVPELLDEARGLGDAGLGRDHVVPVGPARARGVEATLHGREL